jgi:hypothetical protein
MTELLSRFEPGEIIGLLAVAGGLLIGLICGPTAIIADYWHKIRRVETEAALKQDMLSRGMSAEDIQTVIDAGSDGSRKNLRYKIPSKTC